jgi:hypothetical protein
VAHYRAVTDINQCSEAYSLGSEASVALGASRLAYASSAAALRAVAKRSIRQGADQARVALAAVRDRNMLKVMFRAGLFPNTGMLDPAATVASKGAAGAIQSAGRTHMPANAAGAVLMANGLTSCSAR